jgi:hypothetical protein
VASEGLPRAVIAGVGLAICTTAASCASGARLFPLRAPLATDTDLQSFNANCHIEPSKKDAKHVACAPEVYVSPLAWDGIDNSIFRPLTRVFAVDPADEAPNVNSVDEVADSAWFTNRIGARPMSVEEFSRGACEPRLILDDPTGEEVWVVDQGKMNGSSAGFRVNIPGKGKYLFKSDQESATLTGDERPTAASAIGATTYHAVGFFTSCEQIVYFKPSALKLTPGLRYSDNTGIVRDFDKKALEKVLKGTTKRGEFVRMQASAWLPGHLLGPFRYLGTRADDANDVIPHEDRRELRGGRLLAAWLDHFDAREQNSMDSWIADRGKDDPDSSPGYVRHYYLDTSDCLGSEWAWDGISKRLGYSYLLDYGDIALDFVTLGTRDDVWDHIERTPGRKQFGFFNVKDFDPEGWKNEYPNPAFSRMTERDGAWMARILSRFTPETVSALAKLGEFSDPADTAFVAETLEGRLERILGRYLTRLSPIADVHVEDDALLCGVDLAERRRVRDAASFRYEARLSDGSALPVTRRSGGAVCVALPRVAGDSGPADDSPARYFGVAITDGVARGPLVAYLYDRGPARGYALAGIERPSHERDR